MRLLDLFCGAGGCAVGYHRAGFTSIVGVDHKPQPNYPFEFVQADALEYVQHHWHLFDAIHASPPCQAFTVGRHIHQSGHRHKNLIPETREALNLASRVGGKPWVIENVVGSPLSRGSVMLCGLMFGLRVLRHRWFESNHLLLAPPHQKHPAGNLTDSNQGYSTGETGFVCVAGHNFVRQAGAKAMGIDWMKTRAELAQAIPPAYTEYLGRQIIDVIHARVG